MFAHEISLNLPFQRKISLGTGRYLTREFFAFNLKISEEVELGIEILGFFLNLEIKKELKFKRK